MHTTSQIDLPACYTCEDILVGHQVAKDSKLGKKLYGFALPKIQHNGKAQKSLMDYAVIFESLSTFESTPKENCYNCGNAGRANRLTARFYWR